MSDDLNFDMEIVEDDELDDLVDESMSTSEGCSRTDEERRGEDDNSENSNTNPSNTKFSATDRENEEKGAMPSEGDEFRRLSEFIEFKNGNKPNHVSEKPAKEAEAYLTVETLRDGKVKYAVDESAPRAKPDDVLMIMDGSGSGRVYSGRKGIISSTFSALEISCLCPEFVRYFLEHNFRRINSATKGSAVPHTDKDLVRSLEIPSIGIDEQRKISSVLYTVEQVIQKTEAIIEQTKRVKRGAVQNLFTDGFGKAPSRGRQETPIGEIPEDWRLVRLSDVADKITDGPHQSVDRLPKEEEGIPFLYVSCVRHGEIIWEKAGSISEEVYDQILNRVDPKPGSVLYTIVGSYGHAALVEEDRPFGFERNIGFIDPNVSLISPSYLAHWMNSSRCKNYAERVAQGNAQKLIALHSLSNFPVPLPSRKTQRKIANLLSTFDGKIRGEEKRKRRLKRLKRGLMQDLLTGEVRTADKAIEVLEEITAHR